MCRGSRGVLTQKVSTGTGGIVGSGLGTVAEDLCPGPAHRISGTGATKDSKSPDGYQLRRASLTCACMARVAAAPAMIPGLPLRAMSTNSANE